MSYLVDLATNIRFIIDIRQNSRYYKSFFSTSARHKNQFSLIAAYNKTPIYAIRSRSLDVLFNK